MSTSDIKRNDAMGPEKDPLSDLATVEPEVNSGPSNQTSNTEQPKVPEKFQGKSVDEILESYSHLEKEKGRLAQELGELRKVTDNWIKTTLSPTNPDASLTASDNAGSPSGKKEYTLEDFDRNPLEVVEAIIDERTKPLTSALAKTQEERERETFFDQYPDANNVIQDPKFQEWVQRSENRLNAWASARQANNWDAIGAFMDSWNDLTEVSKSAPANNADKVQAAQVTTDGVVSGVSTVGKKKIRRSDLIELNMKDPNRYQALLPEIRKAYAEGRVID